jgi:hypothetical protein
MSALYPRKFYTADLKYRLCIKENFAQGQAQEQRAESQREK